MAQPVTQAANRGRTGALLIAVAAALAVLGVVLTQSGDGDEPRSRPAPSNQAAASAWTGEAAAAYEPLGDTALRLPAYVREWLDGTRPMEQVRVDLKKAQVATTEVRDRLTRLRPFPFDQRVLPLYQSSSVLYVEHVRIYEAALGAPAGDVRTQLDRLARRTRLLGDRVFDRGQALVQPHLDEQPSNPDVVINLPEEVPDWGAEGLAAGPPLAPPPPTPTGPPPLREESRPVQPRASWEAAVRDASAPRVEELRDAMAARDPARLGVLSAQLDGAAQKLRAVADPDGDGGREESARTRLHLLVRSEAMRTGQAAAVFNLPALADVAERVLAAADPLR